MPEQEKNEHTRATFCGSGDLKERLMIREVCVPGQDVGGENLIAGEGTYRYNGRIYAAQLGIKSVRGKTVGIVPLGGRYMPCRGDVVVGVIVDVMQSGWLVDINAPYPAPLHSNEVPWNVEFGDTSRFLNIGEVILTEVISVDEMKKIQVTMNGPELKKLPNGHIVEIPPSKVPRVIGKNGSMIKQIVNYTRCKIFVGQNGRIWIDGNPDNLALVIKTIRKIEAESHTLGLTDRIREMLESAALGLDGEVYTGGDRIA